MNLSPLLNNIPTENIIGSLEKDITDITLRAQDAVSKGVYIAVKGNIHDGHDYIPEALQNGATAILCEDMPADRSDEITYIEIKNIRSHISTLARNFYDDPASSMTVLGVTGTNGKTTTATLLYQVLQKLGFKVALLSTAGNYIDDTYVPATHTTPHPLSLHKLLQQAKDAGCTHVCMEVSSHALDQGRVEGINFAAGIFSNITHDHLDYHGTFEKYIQAKNKLFTMLSKDAVAVVNADDENTPLIVDGTHARKIHYGMHTLPEDRKQYGVYISGKIIANTFEGLVLNIDGKEVRTQLIGSFNAYNILAVYGALYGLGYDGDNIQSFLAEVTPPAGRFEHFADQGRIAIIDYAHTPDALENVLTTIRDVKSENERIITVVGCGGDRDIQKRGPMATIAAQYSDRVIFTSDNPRSEDPRIIIEEMMREIGGDNPHTEHIMTEIDREKAIENAVRMSKVGDIILVAGKGHETYQEIQGTKHPFDDMEMVKKYFAQMEEYE